MYRRRIRAARETMEQLRGNTRRAYELRSRNPIDGLDEIVDRCVGGHVARRSRLGALQNVAAYLLERERQDLGLGRVGLKVFDQAEALVRCHFDQRNIRTERAGQAARVHTAITRADDDEL